MFQKKYLLLVGFIVLMAQTLFAQESQPADPKAPTNIPTSNTQWSNRDMTYRGKNYDVMDSAYYPKFRRKQFKRYMDHQEVFPPKPRNKWEIGFGMGLYNLIGNVPTLMLWQKGGGGVSVNVRKSLGYIFSLRGQYIYGVAKNLDRQPTTGFDAPYTLYNYIPLYYATPNQKATPIYRAARMEASMASIDLMFNAFNINFHQATNKFSFFGFVGFGAIAYKTRMNALDGVFQPYNFGSMVTDPKASNNKIRKALQSKMDKTYESIADNGGGMTFLDNKTLDFAPSVGGGFQYKFNKKINIQLEERFTFPSDVYMDGSRFGKQLGNTVSQGKSSDAVNYFSVSINYNLPTKKKSVEPLYWINPLDHSYSELSYPRHMILPNPVLPDEDGDGITDQFDKCPKTPKGVAVDSHGCPYDTDGDGVPDYKDKQRITPTECQPVDADGVGKCPCPDGCKDLIDKGGAGTSGNNPNGGPGTGPGGPGGDGNGNGTGIGETSSNTVKGPCGKISRGTLLFTDVTHISAGMEAQLATLASQMHTYTTCKVVIVGGGSGSKVKEQHAWEHVNAVIEYMSEKHQIGRDKFIFKYGEVGDENIVTYRGANMEEPGSGNVPPPHPEIK